MDSANATGILASLQIVQMHLIDWVWFVVVALIGGFASSLINNKRSIDRMGWDNPDPLKRKHLNIGLIADLVSGLAAALAILWMMTPQTFFQLIGIGTVAGYGGSAVLQALVNRLTIDVSNAEKATLTNEKTQLNTQLNQLRDIETEIKKKKAEKALIDKIVEARKKQANT